MGFLGKLKKNREKNFEQNWNEHFEIFFVRKFRKFQFFKEKLLFLYAVFATCYAYMEQAVWGIWKPYTGYYFDYFSNWLDLVYCLDTFAIAFMPRKVHKKF